ncbi:MBL fold metallo-hydrolase [Tannerella sp.]|uniref:MBL fold metallo-hydrolase n=1 Tax=Tannerella sp. TaxID=2382127 RepID=UPI0026DB06CA|nr:MBL fold metallo-hydrolase [Tannerella sp.]MDO4703797.1 MBL fold metallo-hydrolase [Tannerella sp.]
MKLTYIFHSGYLVQTERSILIIDYWKDSENKAVERALSNCSGRVYVLCTHWHPDHFNPEILTWKEKYPDIRYVLSKDILKKKLVSADDASFLIKGEVWEDELVRVKAFGSTDVGVSFLIETEGKMIFHAGDLNNWHWDEESTEEEAMASERLYLRELKTLTNVTKRLDLAMFPVDARLGTNYMRGAEQFVDALHTDWFAPMHFGESYETANAFRSYAEKAGCRFAGWRKTGECITF